MRAPFRLKRFSSFFFCSEAASFFFAFSRINQGRRFCRSRMKQNDFTWPLDKIWKRLGSRGCLIDQRPAGLFCLFWCRTTVFDCLSSANTPFLNRFSPSSPFFFIYFLPSISFFLIFFFLYFKSPWVSMCKLSNNKLYGCTWSFIAAKKKATIKKKGKGRQLERKVYSSGDLARNQRKTEKQIKKWVNHR